jgi:hypothetical protein
MTSSRVPAQGRWRRAGAVAVAAAALLVAVLLRAGTPDEPAHHDPVRHTGEHRTAAEERPAAGAAGHAHAAPDPVGIALLVVNVALAVVVLAMLLRPRGHARRPPGEQVSRNIDLD